MGTLAKLSASANSIKYLYTSSGASDTAKVLYAALLTDAVNGPLKTLIEQNIGADLVATQDTPELSIYLTQHSAINGQARFNNDSPDPDGRLLCEAAAAGTAIVEVRYNHSLPR